jgi:hypothetical protein
VTAPLAGRVLRDLTLPRWARQLDDRCGLLEALGAAIASLEIYAIGDANFESWMVPGPAAMPARAVFVEWIDPRFERAAFC